MSQTRLVRVFQLTVLTFWIACLAPWAVARAEQPTPEIVVDPSANSVKQFSAVAADAAGNFVVVWRDLSSPSSKFADGIFGQRFSSAGQPLGSPFAISQTPGASAPSVAMDAQGNFVVAWAVYPETRSQAILGANIVYMRRYGASGAALGNEVIVDRGLGTDGGSGVSVAMNPDCVFAIAWGDSRQIMTGLYSAIAQSSVYLQRYTSNGIPTGAKQTVASRTAYDGRDNTYNGREGDLNPSLAINRSGAVVIAWLHDDPTHSAVVYARQYPAQGPATGPAFQASSNSSVIYRNSAGMVTSVTTFPKTDNEVAIDDAGNFVLSWDGSAMTGPDQFESGVFMRRYSGNGQPLGDESLVVAQVSRDVSQFTPRLILDSAGNAVIAWVSADYAGTFNPVSYSVLAQGFDSNGLASGSPIQLNTRTGETLVDLSLAPAAAGHFLATWTSSAFGTSTPTSINVVNCCSP